MPNFAGARTLPARPRDGEVRGTKSETREGKSLERVAGRPRSDVQGRICYQVTNIPCVYIYIYMCVGIYLVLNLNIYYVGALSRLDYLSTRSCHSISFRLL